LKTFWILDSGFGIERPKTIDDSAAVINRHPPFNRQSRI
jgi:hypothetical protein